MGSVNAQDPHFSQFFASPLTLNPALTGKLMVTLECDRHYRNQWPTINRAYTTTTVSVDFQYSKVLLVKRYLGVWLNGLFGPKFQRALKQTTWVHLLLITLLLMRWVFTNWLRASKLLTVYILLNTANLKV
jgi:hypothetical protein